MTTLSLQKLEKYLKAYSLDIDYWASDMEDTDQALGTREILESHKMELTFSMLERLREIDEKAKNTLDAYRGPESWDVRMLRKIVELANSGQRQAA